MNAESCSLERSQGLDFEKQAQQDYALVNAEKATSKVNMVRCFVVEVASVVVYSGTLVSACHVDESACDLHQGVSVISLAHWKCVVVRLRHSLPIRSRTFVTAAVCY